MNFNLVSILGVEEKSVYNNIVNEVCSYCGACIAVCPKNAVTLGGAGESKPLYRKEECVECSLCRKVCPQIDIPGELYNPENYKWVKALECKTRFKELEGIAQDGGAVSSIVAYALDNKLVDAAVLVSRDENWHPIVKIARTREEVFECAGTKYVYAPLLSVLKELSVDKSVNSICVVGLPCHIRALKKMSDAKLVKYTRKIKLTISLFCTHNFTWKQFSELVAKAGFDLKDVCRVEIKKGKFILKARGGSEKSFPVKEVFKNVRKSCMQCPEFISMYADLNIGSIGSREGYSSLLVMNEKSLSIVEDAVNKGYVEATELGESGVNLIRKFIARKIKHK